MSRPANAELIVPKEEYLQIWYAARESPHGIAIKAYPVDKVRARLWQIRAQAGDLSLMKLDIVKPNHRPNELWLIHRPK
jgi:hypothetical protein